MQGNIWGKAEVFSGERHLGLFGSPRYYIGTYTALRRHDISARHQAGFLWASRSLRIHLSLLASPALL